MVLDRVKVLEICGVLSGECNADYVLDMVCECKSRSFVAFSAVAI